MFGCLFLTIFFVHAAAGGATQLFQLSYIGNCTLLVEKTCRHVSFPYMLFGLCSLIFLPSFFPRRAVGGECFLLSLYHLRTVGGATLRMNPGKRVGRNFWESY